MSGMKNIANAIANDASFASQTKGILSKAEAKQFVCADKCAQPKGVKSTAPKPRSY